MARGKIIEIGGRSEHSTNNIMELTAAIKGLKYLKNNFPGMSAEVYSDSKYVILGITEWMNAWQKNNWRTAGKKPVLNRELWEELYQISEEVKPKWNYTAGHAGDKYNERADQIATSYADNLI